MGIREVLQTEIWTTQTSQRIFRVVVKTLAFIGVAVVCLVIWYVVSSMWLTRPERRTARVALSQIDALQHLDTLTDDEYGAGYKQAEASVHGAEQSVWTRRDGAIADLLSNYLMFTDVRRSERKSKLKDCTSSDERLRNNRSEESQDAASSIMVSGFQSEVLHQALR